MPQTISPANAGTGTAPSAGPPPTPMAGTVNGVLSSLLAIPNGNNTNAITVKAPDDNWGAPGVPYGMGQAFELLKAGSAAVEPDDLVLARINRDGGAGFAGGIHLAAGLRKIAGVTFTQNAWIQNFDDVVNLALDSAPAGIKEFMLLRKSNGDVYYAFGATGTMFAAEQVQAGGGLNNANATTRITIGNLFGAAGIYFKDDTLLYRIQANLLGSPALEFQEITDPAAPVANRARLYLRDSGGGKEQLCLRTPTGVVVIATAP